MKKIGIFYGSTAGTTADVAREIAKELHVGPENIYDVASTAPSVLSNYDVVILGASTYGSGDIQGDMADFLDALEVMDLRGKDVAIFGCGDETMAGTFCDAVGEIFHRLRNTGANFIGEFDTDGYNYSHTSAADHGHIVGLLIDNVNHPGYTAGRVARWADEIMKQI